MGRKHRHQVRHQNGPIPKATVQDAAIFKNQPARDGFDNFVSRLGLNNDNTLSAGTYTFNLITRNRVKLEAAYRGSWLAGVIVDSVAEDMTRAGLDVTTNEADEDLKDLYNAMSRLQVWRSIENLIKWGRLYGGALGVIQIKGQSLKSPLDLDTIGKDQFQGIVVYDRWALNPVLNEVIDSGPEMGLPAYYQIVTQLNAGAPQAPQANGSVLIHHSRVIRYTGIDLPFFQAITEMMWGESVIERLYDRIISFDNASLSTAQLVDRANLRTVKVKSLREIISIGGPANEALLKQFEMMRLMQVNEGLTLIDSEDEFQSTAYSFTGLSDTLLQLMQQISGGCSIPLIRLFGQSPSGLSANGEGDIRMYYDNINAQQESKLRTAFEVLLKVLWRSTFDTEAPKDLEFQFTPLWQMSATDKANVSKTNTETVLGALEANAISLPTAMKELRQMSGDTGLFSNITDEDVSEAEKMEAEMPPLPDEPMPGEEPKEPVKNLDHKPKFLQWLLKK